MLALVANDLTSTASLYRFIIRFSSLNLKLICKAHARSSTIGYCHQSSIIRCIAVISLSVRL